MIKYFDKLPLTVLNAEKTKLYNKEIKNNGNGFISIKKMKCETIPCSPYKPISKIIPIND